MLADFVLQSNAMVAAKLQRSTRRRALLGHVLQVFLGHALLLAPMFGSLGVLLALFAALAHAVIDALKLMLEDWRPAPLGWFALDQAAHWASLAVLATFFSEDFRMHPGDLNLRGSAGLLIACLAFNTRGVGFLVAEFLRRWNPHEGGASASEEQLRMGWMIGVLERTLLFLLMLEGQWGAAGLVITAKSIVRFRELDQRRFSEYYLLGTLASFLGAVVLVYTFRLLPMVLAW